MHIRKAEEVDILIVAEGTYPYIKGGVSSWIHQLINGLPEFTFGVIFLGSVREHYGDIAYKLPDNLAHLEVHFLFEKIVEESKKSKISQIRVRRDILDYLREMHEYFRLAEDGRIQKKIKDIALVLENIEEDFFIHHEYSWEFIKEQYTKLCPDESFVDYFWTVRNMHTPIWKITGLYKNVVKAKVVHSPSTGYAGLLGSLIKYYKKVPFILTEHGIYTRERKIDTMLADWIAGKKIQVHKNIGEAEYIRELWVRFFIGLGKIAYDAADVIISLFHAAREIQISYGAPPEKTMVIPNGVDVKRLAQLREKRPPGVPKVITLLGRVVPIKDIKTFIKAMRIVVDKLPEAEGWIVGPEDEDVEYAQECHKLADALGLSEKVKFLGFQSIADILPKTGILTLTSISEGMPLVVLEAFAAGVPVVSTDVGACRQLIYGGIDEEDIKIGKAGEVTQIANPEALAKAYLKLLLNEEEWKKAQKAAIERVERYYSQDDLLNNYRKLYYEVMEKWQALDLK